MADGAKNWRALADALTYAMTESGVDPDYHYLQGVAHDAVEWLEARGYRIDRPAVLNRPPDTVPAPPPRQPDRALRGYIEQANRRTDDG